ncbi:hypothetical protein [Roseicella aquatilis]|uniref:Uncharacterized protein n=1 Tax=Roseicella aquatilis TaxID=2527868 RepID=A0A4R4D8C1_9PROT|nr:hypothetical protein [Roseicella aquatilis]TCZ56641.1 hypothetical protein EXY23_19830 [Roseicella aquatilis]
MTGTGRDDAADDEAAGRAGPGLDTYLGYARGHGETTDSRRWIADLEDMLRVAWDLMTPAQRAEFRDHPDILAMAEAAGGTPDQP